MDQTFNGLNHRGNACGSIRPIGRSVREAVTRPGRGRRSKCVLRSWVQQVAILHFKHAQCLIQRGGWALGLPALGEEEGRTRQRVQMCSEIQEQP